jgi:hypothetical protein
MILRQDGGDTELLEWDGIAEGDVHDEEEEEE